MNDVATMLDQTKYEHYIVLDERRDGEEVWWKKRQLAMFCRRLYP